MEFQNFGFYIRHWIYIEYCASVYKTSFESLNNIQNSTFPYSESIIHQYSECSNFNFQIFVQASLQHVQASQQYLYSMLCTFTGFSVAFGRIFTACSSTFTALLSCTAAEKAEMNAETAEMNRISSYCKSECSLAEFSCFNKKMVGKNCLLY